MKSEVADRMEKISELFLTAQNNAQKIANLDFLIIELDKTDNEFRSVAYESASMVIASRDLEENNSLSVWKEFLGMVENMYATHVHVGLGWALAQQKNDCLSLINDLDTIMHFRVLDGYGFYDSILRKRKTIDQKIIPSQITNEMLLGYDQGLGRRLYYFAKGSIETIEALVNSFPIKRQENIWRGIGLACSFVGGCDSITLQKIFSVGNKQQLKLGAAIVADARYQSKAITEDIILVCKKWCNTSITETLQITTKAKATIKRTEQNAYIAWLKNILNGFSDYNQSRNSVIVTNELVENNSTAL